MKKFHDTERDPKRLRKSLRLLLVPKKPTVIRYRNTGSADPENKQQNAAASRAVCQKKSRLFPRPLTFRIFFETNERNTQNLKGNNPNKRNCGYEKLIHGVFGRRSSSMFPNQIYMDGISISLYGSGSKIPGTVPKKTLLVKETRPEPVVCKAFLFDPQPYINVNLKQIFRVVYSQVSDSSSTSAMYDGPISC